jgi:DUF1680 family protein
VSAKGEFDMTDLNSSSPYARGKAFIETFDYDGVTLLPGRMQAQVHRAREVYASVSNDSILKGFRRDAGLPHPGDDLRGWSKMNTAKIFGQLLSGMARMGRATGDRSLWDKAEALLEGWHETVPPDGRLRMRPYDWEKLVCGLVDLHLYAGTVAALPILAQATDWAASTFDRTRRPSDNFDFWGAGPGATQEWYTLPENLYRAYLATGERRYKDFGDVWLYEDYWRPLANASELPDVVPVHAYSHANSFSSAAMAYAVTGDARYLEISINAYDFLQRTQCYATGGYGPDERFMPPDGSLGRSLELYAGHAEIPCGTWAGFKLSRYLMIFTGESRFGDWIETMVYNAIGAALPTEPDGRTYYYGDYRLSSGLKQHYWHEWPCCSGTYWQLMADYHNVIYFKAPGTLYVNLFVPSEVTWQHDGQSVRVRQETAYPEAEKTTLHVQPERPARFALKLRIPGWTRSASVMVNGTAQYVPVEPGQWATVDREWRAGDSVTLRMPMELRMSPVDAQHPDRVAILFGPTVLAQDEACCRRPFALASTADLSSALVRDENEPVRFRIVDTAPERHRRFLQPLYTFPAFWPYWVYFDLRAPPLY